MQVSHLSMPGLPGSTGEGGETGTPADGEAFALLMAAFLGAPPAGTEPKSNPGPAGAASAEVEADETVGGPSDAASVAAALVAGSAVVPAAMPVPVTAPGASSAAAAVAGRAIAPGLTLRPAAGVQDLAATSATGRRAVPTGPAQPAPTGGPAVPAVPAAHTDGGATPAVPAVPAAHTDGGATPAVPAAPAAPADGGATPAGPAQPASGGAPVTPVSPVSPAEPAGAAVPAAPATPPAGARRPDRHGPDTANVAFGPASAAPRATAGLRDVPADTQPAAPERAKLGDPRAAGPLPTPPVPPTAQHAPAAAAPDATQAHAPAAAAPSPVEQLVSVLEPLRIAPDGPSEVTLELRPAELGTVRVEVRVDHGVVHLRLHAEQDGTADLLRQSVPDLRAALEEAGLAAGSVGVGAGGPEQQGRRPATWDGDDRPSGPSGRAAARSRASDAVSSVRPNRSAPARASGLDVLL